MHAGLKNKKKINRIQAFETKCLRKVLRISYLEHKINNWVRSEIIFLVGPQHGSDMSHAATASPKPSVRARWRVGDALVGRGHARWTTSKSGHLCPCQDCSQQPPAEKTGRGSLLNRLPCPHPSPTFQSVKELN